MRHVYPVIGPNRPAEGGAATNSRSGPALSALTTWFAVVVHSSALLLAGVWISS